jgi:hypothetical protein
VVAGAALVVASSGDGSVGAFCIKPGRKKLAGETLGEAEKPLHPAVTHAATAAAARDVNTRSNFILVNIDEFRRKATIHSVALLPDPAILPARCYEQIARQGSPRAG